MGVYHKPGNRKKYLLALQYKKGALMVKTYALEGVIVKKK